LLITALVATVAGVFATWALAIARYGGPDEPGHVLRADAVADGHLLGDTVPGLVTGFRAVTAPAGIATGDPKCFRHDKHVAARCAVPDPGVSGKRRVASSAGTNPPWYYAAVGLPVRLIGDLGEATWYRLVAAVLFAVTVAVAIVRARRVGAGNGVLIVVVALSPVAWFLGGVVNPSSAEIALSLVAWIGIERVRVAEHVSGRDLAWIGGPAGLAILIRPIAAIVVLTMLAVVWMVRRGARALDWRQWARLLSGPAAAVLSSVVWSRWSGVAVSDDRVSAHGSVAHIFWQAVTGTADTVHEIGGSLGWLEYSAPWPAQWVWWAAVIGCGVGAWRSNGKLRGTWLFIAAGTLIVPIAFETVLAGRLGFIWQGRYSIPTAMGLVVIGSARWTTSLNRRRGLVATVLAVGATIEVATLWTALRRYTVGTNGSWFFTDAKWHPPLPPFVLLGANAALMTVLVSAFGHELPGAFGHELPGAFGHELPGAFGHELPGAFGHLPPDDIEGRSAAEPLDLLGAEGVHTLEVDQ
jgi:Predicted membrane protein (DUF2142)